MATIEFSNCDIIHKSSGSKNVITLLEDGEGVIERQNIETYYDKTIGAFKQITKPIRINNEINCKYSYEDKGIYLMKYKI